MVDTLSPAARSALMSRIRNRDSKAEMAVRRLLHGIGYRYRVQGSPTSRARRTWCFRGGQASSSCTVVSGTCTTAANTRECPSRGWLTGFPSWRAIARATGETSGRCARAAGASWSFGSVRSRIGIGSREGRDVSWGWQGMRPIKILRMIDAYRARYPDEADAARLRRFIEAQPRCFERDCFDDGHITGSALGWSIRRVRGYC